MNDQEFMRQTANIFCQDPKIRSSQQIKERMQQYDQILCKTLGKVYPDEHSRSVLLNQQLNELPQQNTLLDSFMKSLLVADKGYVISIKEVLYLHIINSKRAENK